MCRSKLVYWRLNYFLWKNAVTLKPVGGSGLKMGIEGSTWWKRPISCDPTYYQRHPHSYIRLCLVLLYCKLPGAHFPAIMDPYETW